MEKPCNKCQRNIEEAILYDEVSCYRTCPEWLKWRQEEDRKEEEKQTV